MKILFIAFANSAHTLKWVNYFKSQHDIMLISFYNSPPIADVDLRYIPVRNKNMAVFQLNKVKRLIDEFKPDIMHAHFASSCGLVAAMTGFHPYVLSVWGDDIFVFPEKSIIHKWAVKYAINSADYITATSKMLGERTIRLIGKTRDIEVIPFGVDLQHYRFVPRPAKDIVHIGTVRGLTPKYGVEYLLRAVADLIKKGRNVKLTIVGDGPIRKNLEILSRDLGIDQQTSFVGFVPNEQVINYLSEFDIFVMPSVGEGETFGVAAVEAMATGLPVVASRIGGLPGVIDDGITGTLVEPGNVDYLVDALSQYIGSKKLRDKHGISGRKKVEKEYNLQENAIIMDNLYNTIKSNFIEPFSF